MFWTHVAQLRCRLSHIHSIRLQRPSCFVCGRAQGCCCTKKQAFIRVVVYKTSRVPTAKCSARAQAAPEKPYISPQSPAAEVARHALYAHTIHTPSHRHHRNTTVWPTARPRSRCVNITYTHCSQTGTCFRPRNRSASYASSTNTLSQSAWTNIHSKTS